MPTRKIILNDSEPISLPTKASRRKEVIRALASRRSAHDVLVKVQKNELKALTKSQQQKAVISSFAAYMEQRGLVADYLKWKERGQ